MPTGEVTFLFSDIEGSTQRWEAHYDAMKAAVARHEQLVSASIQRHGGHVFKTVGDAFCAAFQSAAEAVAAACDAQRLLAEEDFSSVGGLRVRMAVHTGRAEERSADFFGPTVNRVARLMSVAHGGQVLLSGITRQLVHSHLPRGATLVDLRVHRLKDLIEPEHVWQLNVAGLSVDFPSLRSLDVQPNNLQIQRTALIGRERDVEDVKVLLSQHRLLTLLGSGGVGKTRLALQVGADLLDRYPDGVWFADLAPVGDAELVASVIAKAIGMPAQGGERLHEAIPQWLRRKRLLLILDSCEHVLVPLVSLADAILASAPDVRMLPTSRQPLGVDGEVVHRLASLAVPAVGADLRAADLLRFGAIELFADRAKAADPGFTLDDDTTPIVVEICRHLDGIPLAIELAAARVKVLSVSGLAQRLGDRFKILTNGSRTVLPRQKTLAALIDWSYDLLSLQEKNQFIRVSLFAGSFTLDAATMVCDDHLDEIEVLDFLSSLIDKSLVVADTFGDEKRFRLLESTRAYALQKLGDGERAALARRHADYYRDRARENDAWGSTPTVAWLTNVELDLDNYRAALEWALERGHDLPLAGTIAGSLSQFWYENGLEVEGRYWVSRVLAELDEAAHPQVAARLWFAHARLSVGKRHNDYAARSLQLSELAGDRRGVAWALFSFGWSRFKMGRPHEAAETTMRALATMRECGDTSGAALCLMQLASISWNRGAIVSARDQYAEALAAIRANGDEASIVIVLSNLAELEFNDGHFAEALRLADEALSLKVHGKNATSLAISHNNLAAYRIALGDMDGAREAGLEGLKRARQVQNRLQITIALQHLALLGALRGDVQDAARQLGYVDAQYKEVGTVRESTERWSYDKLLTTLRLRLSDSEIEKLVAEGAVWPEDRALDEALKV